MINPDPSLEDVIAELGLTVSAVFVPWSKSRNFKAGAKVTERSLNWRVTLHHKGREVLTCDYTAGIAHCPSYARMRRDGRWISVADAEALEFETEAGRQSGRDAPAYLPGKAITPSTPDVIASLANDAAAIDYPEYEGWADDLGYGRDSRKGEAIYRTCLQTGLTLRAALGDPALSRLRDAAAEW